MTTLKAKLNDLNGLPEPYHALYTKGADGTFDLTGVEGFTPDDRDRMSRALEGERANAKKYDKELKPWRTLFGDKKPEDIQAIVDEVEELRLSSKGKLDESQIEERVAARLKRATSPIERKVTEATEQLTKAQARVAAYEKAEERAAVRSAIQRAAAESNALPEAYAEGGGLLALLEGVLSVEVETDTEGNRKLGRVLSKEGAGYPSGLDPAKLIAQVQAKQGYFWAPSKGGGAENPRGGGGGGANPFTKGKENLTRQMELIRSNPTLAKQQAAAAGVELEI